MFSISRPRQLVVPRLLLRLRRPGFTALVLILLFTSTVEPARSAGTWQDEPVYRMSVSSRELAKKNYLCIGEKMTIVVEVFEPNSLDPQSGFPVTALVTGKRGIVTPDKPVWLGAHSKIPGTAEFTYTAKKAGKEKIFFEAVVPDVMFAGPGDYVEQPLEFEVKNCAKKVNLIFEGQYSDENFYASELGLVEDAIIKQDDTGTYRGSADLEWNVFNHAMTDGSCVWEPYTVTSPAGITAQPDDENDSLGLTITYSDAQHSVTATCAGLGTTTQPTASLLSTLGPTVVIMPSSGGVMTFGQAWPGEFGTFTIIVEPEEEQPAVSKMSDPVAWLLGWFEGAMLLPVERQ